MSKRIIEMDAARGLAALAVVMIHVAEIALDFSCKRDATTLAYVALAVTSRFAVPMFVLLSGMGLALSRKSNEKYLQFLRRRLSKIAPMYVVWSLIYSFTYVASGEIGLRFPSPLKVLSNLITGDAAYHLYFVPKIILLYMLFPLIYRVMSSRFGMLYCALVTIVLSVFRCTVDISADLGMISQVGGAFRWLLYFALGIWLAKPNRPFTLKEPVFKRTAGIALPILLAVMVALSYLSATQAHNSAGVTNLMKLFNILYVPLLTIFIWSREWGNFRLMPVLSYISTRSYGLYLSHTLVLTFFLNFYMWSGSHGIGALYFVGSLAVVGLWCLLLPHLVMKVIADLRRKPRTV